MPSPPICDFGWKAAAFDLPATDGRRYGLTDVAGPSGLLVMFICNHCPYVKAVLDRIVRDCAELRGLGVGSVAPSAPTTRSAIPRTRSKT
jgi:peroxiredoxin